MQGEQNRGKECNRGRGFICNMPEVFWRDLLLKQFLPMHMSSFKGKDMCPVAGHCGCGMVRKVTTHKLKATVPYRHGVTYDCRVCHSKKPNREERQLLAAVKHVVHKRQEQYIVIVEFPLHGLSCDVLIVPKQATKLCQLLVVELDGGTHVDNPWRRRKGQSQEEAFCEVVKQDNKKQATVVAVGMCIKRVHLFQLQTDAKAWEAGLSEALDQCSAQ